MIFAGAFNDGFSGYFLAKPFVAFLIVDSVLMLYKKSKVIILHILVLSLFFFLINYDRSESSLFYPIVNKELIVTNDINFTHDEFYPNTISFYELEGSKEIYRLKKGTKFRVVKVVVTGHPDFSTSYTYKIESNNKELKRFIKKAKTKEPKYGSVGAVFKEFDRDFVYVYGWDLNTLAKKIPYSRENRFEGITFLLVYIIYLPIFTLFAILVLIRYYKEFKNDFFDRG
jgi:hypothetical protein